MKRLGTFLTLLLLIPTASGLNIYDMNFDSDLVELGNEELVLFDDLIIEGNTSMILENVTLFFRGKNAFNITVKDNASLSLKNSTVISSVPLNIRLRDESLANIINSDIYRTQSNEDGDYLNIGLGLSENSHLSAMNSKIGYIRQLDNASTNLYDCDIGELGTRSNNILIDKGSTVETLSLYYENSIVNINKRYNDYPVNFSNLDLVNNTVSHPFVFEGTTFTNPPNIYLANSIATFCETNLGFIHMNDNSVVDCINSTLEGIYIDGYGRVKLRNSPVKDLLCYNGDFNIEIRNSTIQKLVTYMSIGLNLKIEKSELGLLNLMYAHTDAPHNIEFVNSHIDQIYFIPGGPLIYQFSNTTIRQAYLEPDQYNYSTPTLTGAINFDNNFSITYISNEGKISLNRVYKVRILQEGIPIVETPVKITRKNETIFNGTTNTEGEIIFKNNFQKILKTIDEPPYLINVNEFTTPLILTCINQNYTINFDTDTPIKIMLNKETQTIEDQSIPIVQPVLGIILFVLVIHINKRITT